MCRIIPSLKSFSGSSDMRKSSGIWGGVNTGGAELGGVISSCKVVGQMRCERVVEKKDRQPAKSNILLTDGVNGAPSGPQGSTTSDGNRPCCPRSSPSHQPSSTSCGSFRTIFNISPSRKLSSSSQVAS